MEKSRSTNGRTLVLVSIFSLGVSILSMRLWGTNRAKQIDEKVSKLTSNPNSDSRFVESVLGRPTRIYSGREYTKCIRSQINQSYRPEAPNVECNNALEFNWAPTLIVVFLDQNGTVIKVYKGET